MNDIDPSWFPATHAEPIDAMLLMIENAYKFVQSDRVMIHRNAMTNAEFRQQFGTLQIRMYRQSGHSTAAAMMLYALDDAVVFVLNNQGKQYMEALIHKMSFLSFNKRVEMTSRVHAASTSNLRWGGIKTDSIVILDMASSFQITTYGQILTSFEDVKLLVELQ